MFIRTKGLILREVRYKEADRILTLYSESNGKITVTAHGAYSKKNKLAAATQALTYSDFVLENRNGRYTVKEASLVESFPGLRKEISKYYLSFYILEIIDAFIFEEVADNDLLRLALNSLYALSNNLCPDSQVKAAFELKLCTFTGYEPSIRRCCECGKDYPDDPLFCPESGIVCCRECYKPSLGTASIIEPEILSAMRYILSANLKSFLSFSLPQERLQDLEHICERYFLMHSERKFSTLELWKSVNKND
jgi:DNA repair protein RecO (recombination protein O)